MPSNKLDLFQLPRLDWYDSEGRINKTALIQNFNAIEKRLNELAGVSPIEIITPNWNTVDIPDTTLDSADNEIVNLKSFIDIMGLKNIPIIISFNGTTLQHLAYYDDTYTLVNIRNVKLSDLDEKAGNIWIYLNSAEKRVYSSIDGANPNKDILIGVYNEGMVFHTKGTNICDINILEPMANMKIDLLNVGNVQTTGNVKKYTLNGRVVGYTQRHDHTTSFTAIFQDQGNIQ